MRPASLITRTSSSTFCSVPLVAPAEMDDVEHTLGIAALICFALIVTIPFGVASLRLAVYALWPFGRTVVSRPTAGVASGIANILWVVLAGWWLALGHVVAGVAQCVTIIGIQFGIANFKLVQAAFWPLGREIVDLD